MNPQTPTRSRSRTRGAQGTRARAPAARWPSGHGRGQPPAEVARRRRLVALVAVLLVAFGVAALAGLGPLGEAVREVTLPLRHDDIIRQQAEDKDLDPALIAAVIYEESRFRPRTSPAGAEGLMQITPQTARFIAERSGATTFRMRDLGDAQINISYGSFYLRYLIDRYDGEEELAIAAYNAGGTHVDRWVERAGGTDDFDPVQHIQFPETSAYVRDVLERREQYREHYAEELGL